MIPPILALLGFATGPADEPLGPITLEDWQMRRRRRREDGDEGTHSQ